MYRVRLAHVAVGSVRRIVSQLTAITVRLTHGLWRMRNARMNGAPHATRDARSLALALVVTVQSCATEQKAQEAQAAESAAAARIAYERDQAVLRALRMALREVATR